MDEEDSSRRRHQRKYKKKSEILSTTVPSAIPIPPNNNNLIVNNNVPQEPFRRRRGVTETPDMTVVIGYNLGYPNGIKGDIPRILINSEPLPDRESICTQGLPGFQEAVECKRVIFRPVPGNDFFYELIKTNLTHERLFLVCEPTEGSKITKLSGRSFNILFIGREGKELLSLRPCPNTKETVSVYYKQNELGRITRHAQADSGFNTGSDSHTVLDRDLRPKFLLRKKIQVISSKKCCFAKNLHKVDNGYNIFICNKTTGGGGNDSTTDDGDGSCVGCICASNTELKFSSKYYSAQEPGMGLEDKILLLATLVSIRTKALESAGIGFRLSLAF